MSIFSAAGDLVGSIGFGVIKNSGRIVLGGGKALLGAVTGEQALVDDGLGTMGKGTVGLGLAMFNKTLNNEDSEQTETVDPFNE